MVAYLRRIRMEHAESLLMQTSLPVKDIASEIGILTNNSLTRPFGDTLGMRQRRCG